MHCFYVFCVVSHKQHFVRKYHYFVRQYDTEYDTTRQALVTCRAGSMRRCRLDLGDARDVDIVDLFHSFILRFVLVGLCGFSFPVSVYIIA